MVVALGLSLVGLSMWVTDNVGRWSHSWQHDVDMVVYFSRDAAPDRTLEVAAALRNLDAVESVEHVSRSVALTRLRAELGDDIVDGVDARALPESLEVAFADGVGDVALAHPLVDRLRSTEGVAEVEWVSSQVEELTAIANGLDDVVAVVMAFSLCACAMLVFVGMRWRAMADREDERVLAILAAPVRTILWPRAIEGLLHGLVGAAAAIGVCSIVHLVLSDSCSAAAQALFGTGEVGFLSSARLFGLVGLGAASGLFGGLMAGGVPSPSRR